MKLIGFNFSKILAERFSPIKGNLEVKANIQVENITEEKLDIVKDDSVAKFEFKFTVDYNPQIASILFRGHAFFILDKKVQKELMKSWKDKKIPEDTKVKLYNLILDKCNLKALMLEEELSLPSHIPFPFLKSQEEVNNKPKEQKENSSNKANYAG